MHPREVTIESSIHHAARRAEVLLEERALDAGFVLTGEVVEALDRTIASGATPDRATLLAAERLFVKALGSLTSLLARDAVELELRHAALDTTLRLVRALKGGYESAFTSGRTR